MPSGLSPPGANLPNIMYLGKRRLNNPAEYEKNRLENIKAKASAVWLAFFELDGLINKTRMASQYFSKTQGWFSQRLNGCISHKVQQRFNQDEYHQLAEAFRDIARRLNAHADEIDNAAPDETEEKNENGAYSRP